MLKRDAKGLGFSIAGGKDANPYNSKNDEVSFLFLKYLYLIFMIIL